MSPVPVPVAIVGASGYTGAEILRLLAGHPRVAIAGVYARKSAGTPLFEIFPQFAGHLALTVEAFDADRVAARARIAFLALPHGDSAAAAAALRDRDVLVIDLSADFRLRDPAVYAAWYGGGEAGAGAAGAAAHPAPERLAEAVYGLPERHRAALRTARLVAGPGCYPTGAILAIALLLGELVDTTGLIIDAKSGASGAGRTPAQATLLAEAAEGVRAYKVAGAHRHTPEIEQELSRAAGVDVRVTFTPHLCPMSRGIFTCAYGQAADPAQPAAAYQAALERAYAEEPFVTVLPPGRLPDTAHVRGSNHAQVAVALDRRTSRVIAMSAIDNLVKGAAGQAVQCLNLTQGWDETAGLGGIALFP
jgi:N-acetyl-gamma-glutamyl-phosphate reductase